MNFEPNESSYHALAKAIENIKEAVSDIESVKFEIESEDDNVSSELSNIEKDVNKGVKKLETNINDLNIELASLISSDFQETLHKYSKLAMMFSEIDKSEYFYDNNDGFPFSSWGSIDHFKFNFSEIRHFFDDLPKGDEDLNLFYYNLQNSVNAIQKNEPKNKYDFFKSVITYVGNLEPVRRNQFLEENFENDINYKNTFAIMALNNQLSEKDYPLENLVPEMKNFLQEQLTDDSNREKFIKFILTDESNNKNYCYRDIRNWHGRVTHYYFENLTKLVELDFELKTEFSGLLIKKLEEIVVKDKAVGENLLKFEELKSFQLNKSLDNKLDTKEKTKGAKI